MSHGLRAELRDRIPENVLYKVPRSYDVIGSKQKAVAVIELPEGLREHEVTIANALMSIQKNVKSVLVKESKRVGEYRTRELRLVAGDPDTEVLHKESGCLFRLDPKVVYFSPRECTERERVAEAVVEGEEVLVMFSGVGSFPICIAKRHRNVRVTAVELNPEAHNYCVENIHLNGVGDRVTAIRGDVREVCKGIGRDFDRVIMPLPKGAHKFLDVAIPVLKYSGILHFYHWASVDDLFTEGEWLVGKAAENLGLKAEFIDRVRISQYSPRIWKIRLDARIFLV